MKYKSTKNTFSNLAFPTSYKVDYAKPIYDESISPVTYGTPSYATTLETVIDSAKAAVVTAPIATVTTPASLDNYIASNAYSNRAAYYGNLSSKLKETTSTQGTNEFAQNLNTDLENKAMLEAARKAKEEAAIKAAKDLQEAMNRANAPTGGKESATQEIMPVEVEAVTPIAKAKSSNAMLYIGVIAVGIVGLMLLKNR
jgi:hypothetical protein